MLGKLRRSLNKRCPWCKSILQIRVVETKETQNDITFIVSKEYIQCSNKSCSYSKDIEEKRKRRKEESI